MAETADRYDSLHPPAVVHIPDDLNDPASPGTVVDSIDSPLSSPPNSPNAWDVNQLDDDEEEEEGMNLPEPLNLPSLNHNAGPGNEPMDEDVSTGNMDSKAAALASIRNERQQRKMKRRQQLLSDQNHCIATQQQQHEELPFDAANTPQQNASRAPLLAADSPQPFDTASASPAKKDDTENIFSSRVTPKDHPFDASPRLMRQATDEQPFDASPQLGKNQLVHEEPFDASRRLGIHPSSPPLPPVEEPFDIAPAPAPENPPYIVEVDDKYNLPPELPPLSINQAGVVRSVSDTGISSSASALSTSFQRRLNRYLEKNSDKSTATAEGASQYSRRIPEAKFIPSSSTIEEKEDDEFMVRSGPEILRVRDRQPEESSSLRDRSFLNSQREKGRGRDPGESSSLRESSILNSQREKRRDRDPGENGSVRESSFSNSQREWSVFAAGEHSRKEMSNNQQEPSNRRGERISKEQTFSSNSRQETCFNRDLPFEDELGSEFIPPVVDLTGYESDGEEKDNDIPDDERGPSAASKANSTKGPNKSSNLLQQKQPRERSNSEHHHSDNQFHVKNRQAGHSNSGEFRRLSIKMAKPPGSHRLSNSRSDSLNDSQGGSMKFRYQSPATMPQTRPEPPRKLAVDQRSTSSSPTIKDILSVDPYARSSSRVSAQSESQILLKPRAVEQLPSSDNRSDNRRSSALIEEKRPASPSYHRAQSKNVVHGNSDRAEKPRATARPLAQQKDMASELANENETTSGMYRPVHEDEKSSKDGSIPMGGLPGDSSEYNQSDHSWSRPTVIGTRNRSLSPQKVAQDHVRPSPDAKAARHVVQQRFSPVSSPTNLQHQSQESKISPRIVSGSHKHNVTSSISQGPVDDDASWLAKRLRVQHQTCIDGDISRLAERKGPAGQGLMDEDASWLAGRLGGARGDDSTSNSGRRQLGDAPGSAPGDAPGSAPLDSIASRSKPTPTKNSDRKKFSQRNVGGNASNQQAEAKMSSRGGSPNQAGWSESIRAPRSERKPTYHQKVPSGDSPKQAQFPRPSQQPMRRASSDTLKHQGSRISIDQEYSPCMINEEIPPPGYIDDESSAGDIGSLIESLDEMVKDLEGKVTRTPEKKVRHEGYDWHSVTEASEGQIGANLMPRLQFTGRPVVVQPINNDIGIPKGDIMISLLSENMDIPWSARIDEAVWRCRTMRQHCDIRWLKQKLQRKPNSPSHGRTSVVVDVDEARVVGGIESVTASQKAALEHLKYDDLDDALALYEDIVEAYYSYFEESLKHNTQVDNLDEHVMLFNSYISGCLHNIGLVYLLLKKPKEAYVHFERAATKRSVTLGVGHTDHLASHVKAATCHIAIGRHNEALVILEECLALSRDGARSISDQRQVAEIYNNLACLYYSLGNHERSSLYFMQSFEAQTIALEHSLYAGARFSCHSATLNLSVTKGNIGFLALLARNHEVALDSLEYAVHNQQLLLRDAHTTLIATMDHLVVAQLFAGNKGKAIRLLRRMYHMQTEAFGPSDERCIATSKKLNMLEDAEPQVDQPTEESLDTTSTISTNTEEKRRPNILKLFKSMARK